MPTYKLTLEYEGTRYSGWQAQGNTPKTIQGNLLRAAMQVLGDVDIGGAGRTDAGVHAVAQVAHLRAHKAVDPLQLTRKLNDLLPADINILRTERAQERFHARHDAISRVYLYQIARRRTAFAKPFVWWVKEPIDPGAMRQAAQAFVGMRDFQSFAHSIRPRAGTTSRADDEGDASTLVLVERLDIVEADGLVLVGIEGSHFLWKMVRRMVGVLVEIGRGGLEPADAAKFLTESSSAPARLTAPPSGLFLDRVYYKGDARSTALRAATPLR